jgi:hypothetical protein
VQCGLFLRASLLRAFFGGLLSFHLPHSTFNILVSRTSLMISPATTMAQVCAPNALGGMRSNSSDPVIREMTRLALTHKA